MHKIKEIFFKPLKIEKQPKEITTSPLVAWFENNPRSKYSLKGRHTEEIIFETLFKSIRSQRGRTGSIFPKASLFHDFKKMRH